MNAQEEAQNSENVYNSNNIILLGLKKDNYRGKYN